MMVRSWTGVAVALALGLTCTQRSTAVIASPNIRGQTQTRRENGDADTHTHTHVDTHTDTHRHTHADARTVNIDNDLIWHENPRAWHQQLARIVDHRFGTLPELVNFAVQAKAAGVSALMLAQVQKTADCPGPWYNGLQLCGHINGSYPAADGTLKDWQDMLRMIEPMRLMWWINPTYWSVQGDVWAEAVADKTGDVGRWFSWNVTADDACDGVNPCDGSVCAQGSWGSTGMKSGVKSAMASWGSPTYADYMVDSMANSWAANLGVVGFTVDCSANYRPGDNCQHGMLQCPGGDGQLAWADIVSRVRQLQPNVVTSGESYGSWDEVIRANADMGGQGFNSFHEQTQAAIFNRDLSDLEDLASSTGADAATVLCYSHPHFDGQQPGACPTMYFRDLTATISDVNQHEMWVALEATLGIVSEHDYDAKTGKWWNVTNDPSGSSGTKSPLWAFTKNRALNRLALRTKLDLVSNTSATPATVSSNYTVYAGENCYNGNGGVEIDHDPAKNLSITQCEARCDLDTRCSCVVRYSANEISSKEPLYDNGDCWKRSSCLPSHFEYDEKTRAFSVYVKRTAPPPPPLPTGGALAILKHDSLGPMGDAAIVVFNPGPAQTVTIDLSMLPTSLFGSVIPVDLFVRDDMPSTVPALASAWTIKMEASSMRAFGGFTLGVFAPRLGKKSTCTADDGYNRTGSGTTLQACFLECLRDPKCDNVYFSNVPIYYMEKPPAVTCTLLGSISNPNTSCTNGTGTLVTKLPKGRPSI